MIRLLARTALVVSLALVGCGDDDPPSGPSTPTVLTSGTPVANISGGRGSQRMYRINVPSGSTRLLITTTGGGTADVDMFVKRGTPPTTTSTDDDCDSIDEFAEETCDISPVTPGDYYIMLYAWDSYSGVTLTATVTRP